jgi:hypothetical protein
MASQGGLARPNTVLEIVGSERPPVNLHTVANIALMNSLESFDVVIICCGKPDEAVYWQQRLTEGKGSIVAHSSTVIAVHEDWPGGAGNGTCLSWNNF